jgi:hypothetical protein
MHELFAINNNNNDDNNNKELCYLHKETQEKTLCLHKDTFVPNTLQATHGLLEVLHQLQLIY